MKSNKPVARRRRTWLATLALLGHMAVAAEPSGAVATSQTPAAAAHRTGDTPVTEGRDAVEFHPARALNGEDPWRLSDKRVPYPAARVDRLQPLFEAGDPFLGNGPIRPGLETPFGQMLQPSFLLFGSFRTALQTLDDGQKRISEWANRLDLHGNLHLSGTERLLFSMRPLDHRSGRYSGYSFEPDDERGWQEDFNPRLTQLFFEGDLGEIVPGLDPDDSHTYDIGFSVGRQTLRLQDGMLANDIVDMVGITRNSLTLPGLANLRLTGLYAWDHVIRGNNEGAYTKPHSATVLGLLAQADTALDNTLSLDLLYVRDSHDENAWYAGVSSTQRFGALNSTFRINASIPEGGRSPTVGRGVLLLSQLSRTLPGSDHLVYFNTFGNIGRFTSAARGPDQGSPVANLGILYNPVGMGRYGIPLGQSIEDSLGATLGYQMFLDGIDSQLIFEIGARSRIHGGPDRSAIGFGARYQRAIGRRHVLRLDAFQAGQERLGFAYGFRMEWMVKF